MALGQFTFFTVVSRRQASSRMRFTAIECRMSTFVYTWPLSPLSSLSLRDARSVWDFEATHAYGVTHACHTLHTCYERAGATVLRAPCSQKLASSNRATECELMNFRVRNLPKNIKISKSFLPQASLHGLVAFQKLGSRMDAPIFVFDGVCEIELQW